MKKLIYLTLLLLVPLAGAQEKVVNSYGTVPQVGFGSVASNALKGAQLLPGSAGTPYIFNTPLAHTGNIMEISNNNTNQIVVDSSTTAHDTRLLLFDVDSGAVKRVSVGANDSGGGGFKVLRIPN